MLVDSYFQAVVMPPPFLASIGQNVLTGTTMSGEICGECDGCWGGGGRVGR